MSTVPRFAKKDNQALSSFSTLHGTANKVLLQSSNNHVLNDFKANNVDSVMPNISVNDSFSHEHRFIEQSNDCQDDEHSNMNLIQECEIDHDAGINEKFDCCSNVCTLESGIIADVHDKRKTSLSQTIDKLNLEMEQLKLEIATKDQQLSVMRTFQNDASIEIEELTASLFTEAYKMVNYEKSKYSSKEKECEELRFTLQELQANQDKYSSDRIFESIQNLPIHLSKSDLTENSKESRSMLNIFKRSSKKRNSLNEVTLLVDPSIYQEFRIWIVKHQRSTTADFFTQLIETDMRPNCIFPTSQDSNFLLNAIINRKLEISKLSAIEISKAYQERLHCALCPTIFDVEYKFRVVMNDNSVWKMLSAFAAKRLESVCDLHQFLLFDDVSSEEYQHVYKTLVNKRRVVFLSRLGYPST